MASIKKKSSGGGGGANWMDTYGDMVTLLLCFFVLLYSISTIDASKWMLVVQSFNRDALVNPQDTPPGPVGSDTGSGGQGLPATTEEALDELFEFLQTNVASDDIVVSRGDGYVFVSFAEAVFFGPDSSALRREGALVLDQMIPALTKCAPNIDELKVIGHTAQANPNRHNNVVTDRQLASARATSVVIHLQQNISNELLNPGRLVPEGMGEWRNVASNDTAEGKAKNRRVEMIISGKNLEDVLSDSYQQYQTILKSTGSINVPD